jgi:hypothetical protein
MKNKTYYSKNKEKIKKVHKKYYVKNKSYYKKYHEIYDKIYYKKNKKRYNKRGKIYYKNNILKFKKLWKLYYKKNKIFLNKKATILRFKKYHTNISFKLKHLLRTRIRSAIKNNSKAHKTIKLLGCSIDFLKQHLEKQFKNGMSWKNYGFYGWHIDHIRPCCSFDLSKKSEQMKCFHYKNLQPLWAKDNRIKYYTKDKFLKIPNMTK